jgi:hypothetical protein
MKRVMKIMFSIFLEAVRLDIETIYSLFKFIRERNKMSVPLFLISFYLVILTLAITISLPMLISNYNGGFDFITFFYMFIIGATIIFLFFINPIIFNRLKASMVYNKELFSVFIKTRKRVDSDCSNYFNLIEKEENREIFMRTSSLVYRIIFKNLFIQYLYKLKNKMDRNIDGLATTSKLDTLYNDKNFENYYSSTFFDTKDKKLDSPFSYICFNIKSELIKFFSTHKKFSSFFPTLEIDKLVSHIVKSWFSELNRRLIKK